MPRGQRELYERLISEVQSLDVLYNPAHMGYKDRTKTDPAWVQVANAVGLTVAEAKRTWGTLRSSYNRSLNSEKQPSAHGLPARSKWYLSDQMSFLRQYLHNGFLIGNLGMTPEETEVKYTPDSGEGHPILSLDAAVFDEDVLSELEDKTASVGSAEEEEEGPTTTGWEPKAKKLKLADKVDAAMLAYLERKQAYLAMKAAGPVKVLEGDPDFDFFQWLLPTFKELDNKRKRQVRMEILQVVNKALDHQEEEQRTKPGICIKEAYD